MLCISDVPQTVDSAKHDVTVICRISLSHKKLIYDVKCKFGSINILCLKVS
jgi:hypothetical protein